MENLLKNKSLLTVAVLIIVAFVLGVLIYNKYSRGAITLNKMDSNGSLRQSRQSQSSQQDTREKRPTPEGLSAEELKLFTIPMNASQEFINERFKLVEKLSKEGDTIDLNKCEKPSPLVLKVEEGTDITIKNSDSIEHNVFIYRNSEVKVPANQNKTVKANFERGPGYYAYQCDNLAGIVGYILVAKKGQ